MSNRQTLYVLLGGFSSAILGWLVTGLVGASIIRDGGDDGVLLYMSAGAILFGIAGFLLSIKWVRKHIKTD